jgi:hypothetical protein
MFRQLLVFLLTCLPAMAFAGEGKRVQVPIGRTVPVITADNPTPYFRWPLQVLYLSDGHEWVPDNCNAGIAELRVMVAAEFLEFIERAHANHARLLRGNPPWSAAEIEEFDNVLSQDLEKRYPGEEGFTDEVKNKIMRSWLLSRDANPKFVRSCKEQFGADEQTLAYAVIFAAAFGH